MFYQYLPKSRIIVLDHFPLNKVVLDVHGGLIEVSLKERGYDRCVIDGSDGTNSFRAKFVIRDKAPGSHTGTGTTVPGAGKRGYSIIRNIQATSICYVVGQHRILHIVYRDIVGTINKN